ncbi:MAG: DNA-binding response regulator [Candidatus Xenobia bacterium]
MIRVMLVDDHRLLRQALKPLLESSGEILVVAEAGRLSEALREISQLEVDVLIADIAMPDGSGLDLVQQVEEIRPGLPFLFLTMCLDDRTVVEAVDAGARGIVPKSADIEDLMAAIRTVAAGDFYIHSQVAGALMRQVRHRAQSVDPLTGRERLILTYLAQGLRTGALAVRLSVSESTVKAHLRSLYQKLGVTHRTEAVLRAVELGLVSPQIGS